MPRFALTFDYASRHDKCVSGEQVVIRDSIEEAAEYIAAQRPGLASIHIRTCNGEVVEREFTFGPSDAKAVA